MGDPNMTKTNRLDLHKKYRKPVVSNFDLIKPMSTKKLRDLLKNNCIGESGREYCEQTIRDVLAQRGTLTPKETNQGPTLVDCFEYCSGEYARRELSLNKKSVAWLELSRVFSRLGLDAAVEQAKAWALELTEIAIAERAEEDQALREEMASNIVFPWDIREFC
jgi:hypothetical protein